MSTPGSRRSTIPTLDGWRAVAILMITVYHVALNGWLTDDTPSVFRLGTLGVDVFFGLSGILITKLLLEENDRQGRISLKAFYVRRAYRILLPCYCYLAVLGILSLFETRMEFLSSLLFFRNYLDVSVPGTHTTFLWSLSVEEHFYLLWPPILVLATVKHGREVAMWMAVGCALWRTAVEQNFPALANFGAPHFRTDFRLDALLWGAVLAFVLHESYGKLRKGINPLVWAGILTAFVLCLVFNSRISLIWIPMLIPLLVAGTLTHPEWRLSRILDSRPMVWVGRLSYSLYLWQGLFLIPYSHSPRWWQHFPANLPLTVGAAMASFYWIETPLRRVAKRISDRLPVRAAPAVIEASMVVRVSTQESPLY